MKKKICIAGGDPMLVESPTEPKWSSKGTAYTLSFSFLYFNCRVKIVLVQYFFSTWIVDFLHVKIIQIGILQSILLARTQFRKDLA